MSAVISGALFAGSFLVENTGQVGELAQNHKYHKEAITWARRNFQLDAQSLLLDALDHSKEEIRSTYETYMGRIDTPLLVLALIWPFALNTIQFSDPFVPQSADKCPDCIEAQYPWLIGAWVFLMGTILVLPFWGILMFIRCKRKLDNWLEVSLAAMSRERSEVHDALANQDDWGEGDRDISGEQDRTKQRVGNLVTIVNDYQMWLVRIWESECGWLVRVATMFLWMSATAALLLTSLSMLVFLQDKGGMQEESAPYFGFMIAASVVIPIIYICIQKASAAAKPPEESLFHEEEPFAASMRAQTISRRLSQRYESPRSFSESEIDNGSRRPAFGFALWEVRFCQRRKRTACPESRRRLLDE